MRYGVLEVRVFGFGVTWFGVRSSRYGFLEVRCFWYGVSGSLFGVSGTGCAVRGFHGRGFRVLGLAIQGYVLSVRFSRFRVSVRGFVFVVADTRFGVSGTGFALRGSGMGFRNLGFRVAG